MKSPAANTEKSSLRSTALTVAAKQAARKADLAKKRAQLAKAAVKAAKRAYKVARKAVKKAAKKARRAEASLKDWLKSEAKKLQAEPGKGAAKKRSAPPVAKARSVTKKKKPVVRPAATKPVASPVPPPSAPLTIP